jgi:GntR family transcriptional regulator, transcriptional repressor for pyruvate dehydrogenase complex
MFQSAKPTKIFQDVVSQIEEAILSGRLQTGQTLPSERELKETFHISRGTLREALRVLEQKGLIEIRLGVGGGSVVRSVETDQVSESLGLLIRSQRVSLNHLGEFREALEGIIAAQAAERRTPEDVARLKALVAEARDCVDAGPARRDEFLEADKRIHLAIAGATGNPLHVSVLASIHDNIHRYYERFLSMDDTELDQNYRDLRELVAAVARGSAADARRLAQAHVERFNLFMKQREALESAEPAPPAGRAAPRRRRRA